MVHEATGLWHGAGFNVSRWLMIIIHGYRATTLLLSILLNVLVRTAGKYRRVHVRFSVSSARLFRSLPYKAPISNVCVSLDGTFRRFAYGESIPCYVALVIVALSRPGA